MEQLHLLVRFHPADQAFYWEIGHQREGALSFGLSPPDFRTAIAYIDQLLKTKGPVPRPQGRFWMEVVYQPESSDFEWIIGDPSNAALRFVLNSGSLARVLEYLETVLQSAAPYIQE